MLRQRARMLTWLLAGVDAVVLITAFLVAYVLREHVLSGEYGGLLSLGVYLPVLVVALPIWLGLMAYFGLYRSYRTRPAWAEPAALLQAAVLATVLTAAAGFAFKLTFVSRLLVGLHGAVALALLFAARTTVRRLTRRARAEGYNTRNVVIVGSGRWLHEAAKVVRDNREWGLRLLGVLHDYATGPVPKAGEPPVLGHVQQLPEILKREVVDEIIFTASRQKLEEIEHLLLVCEELGVRAHVAMNFFPHVIAKMHLDTLANMPILTFSTTPYNEFLLVLKRAFDIVAASLLIAGLSPVLLATAVAVKLTSPGPVLFRQMRVGLNGRRFTLYKFRSMVQDAEARKAELLHMNEMRGPVFKMRKDPRLTPIGGILRRLSLDELPQLFNVLQGTMSMVGPRPPVPEEVGQYESWQRRRLSMKPGITCLWQINGRSSIDDFERWMELDLHYIDNWSLTLDLKIFAKTIPAVLLGKGAV